MPTEFLTLSFVISFGRFCHFSGLKQTVLLFLAHFQALIWTILFFWALFQLLFAKNVGILSTFSGINCGQVL